MLIEINDIVYNKILKYSKLNDLDINTYINHLIEKSFIEDNYSIFNQKKSEEKPIEIEKDVDEKDENISAYSASSFYAVDRYASFKKDWEKDYRSGVNIISARYTTSNAVYQTTKLPENMWDEYCGWLYDYEYKKLGIPRPDAVIFLDMPVEVSQKLLSERYNNDEHKKDIHEANVDYLRKCREAALYVSRYDENESWTVIECCKDGKLRSIEDINNEIISIISKIV
jgi:dTMP kinase